MHLTEQEVRDSGNARIQHRKDLGLDHNECLRVFLSYHQSDLAKAETLTELLTAKGHAPCLREQRDSIEPVDMRKYSCNVAADLFASDCYVGFGLSFYKNRSTYVELGMAIALCLPIYLEESVGTVYDNLRFITWFKDQNDLADKLSDMRAYDLSMRIPFSAIGRKDYQMLKKQALMNTHIVNDNMGLITIMTVGTKEVLYQGKKTMSRVDQYEEAFAKLLPGRDPYEVIMEAKAKRQAEKETAPVTVPVEPMVCETSSVVIFNEPIPAPPIEEEIPAAQGDAFKPFEEDRIEMPKPTPKPAPKGAYSVKLDQPAIVSKAGSAVAGNRYNGEDGGKEETADNDD